MWSNSELARKGVYPPCMINLQEIAMIRKSRTGTVTKWKSGMLGALAADERGAVAVIAAIVFPAMVGGMGLGAETGYWYLKQRKLQHAADVAVHAAAVRHRAGDQQPALEETALRIASATGYLPGVGTISVGTDTSGGAPRVAVELTEMHSRLFSSIFSAEPMLLGARAVAEITGGSNACVLALSGTASGAVTVSGSTSVGLANCSVASNSTASNAFLMDSGNAKIATDCVYTVGGAVTTTGLSLTVCSNVTEHASPTLDPYAGVAEPDPQDVKVLPGKIDQPTHLDQGVYVIDGDLELSGNGKLTGDGVTLLFTGSGCAKLTGNNSVNLTASFDGPYAGILFFGSRDGTCPEHTVLGNSDSKLQGTLYMPASPIKFSGNSTVDGGCTQIIADRVTFTGNSTIETCSSGTKEILVGQTISIIE
jgi:Flp pilus assembly protein TadG